jgi:hypothetical protein
MIGKAEPQEKTNHFSIIDQAVSLQFFPESSTFKGTTQIRIRLNEPPNNPVFLHLGSNIKISQVIAKDIEIAKKESKKQKSKNIKEYTDFKWTQIDQSKASAKVKEYLANGRRDLDAFEDMNIDLQKKFNMGQLFLNMKFKDDCKYKKKEKKLYEQMCLFYTVVIHFKGEALVGPLEQMKVKLRGDVSNSKKAKEVSVIFKKGFIGSARYLFPCVDLFDRQYFISLIRVTVPEGYQALTSGKLHREVLISSGGSHNESASKGVEENVLISKGDDEEVENQSRDKQDLLNAEHAKLEKRNYDTFKEVKKTEEKRFWKVFEYKLESKCIPSQIGLVIGPFVKMKSSHFINEIWYLKDNFENEKEIQDILVQYGEFEERIFSQNDFFKHKETYPSDEGKK